MKGRSFFTLAAVACLATAPVVAQQPAAATATQAPVPAQRAAGPRLEPGYRSYQPAVAQPAVARHEASLSTTAAADRTVITISTLGLVLLAVLLIILLT